MDGEKESMDGGKESMDGWMDGWREGMDGWTKRVFVRNGETVDGSVNEFLSQLLLFLKIKLQIDIQDNVR